MIKPLTQTFEAEDNEKLEERLAYELEERLELGCWVHCICNDNVNID